MSVSKPFADILAARREVFNGRVSHARASASGFDSAAFSEFLAGEVDDIVSAVHCAQPGAAARVAEDVFEMAINLVAQRRAGPGARDDLVNYIWQEIAPGMADLIAEDALETLGALTNAAVYLGGLDGVRLDEWTATLETLSPQVKTTAQLRQMVTVIAWRAGAAHMRSAALEAASALPSRLACAAIGAPDGMSWKAAASALADDIWWTPEGGAEPVEMFVGGFTGFGGPFGAPPELKAVEDGFLALSDGRYFHLTVDAFGAIFQSAEKIDWDEEEMTPAPATIKQVDNVLYVGDREIAISGPRERLGVYSNHNTVAVTSAHSHSIRLFARKSPT